MKMKLLLGLYIAFVYTALVISIATGLYISFSYANDLGLLLVAINIFIFYKFTAQVI